MRIDYIKLRDFGPFRGTHTIDLSGTLIGIIGHNGAGKSTVVEAIYSALTGDFRKYATLSDYVTDLPDGEKASSGSIEVGFKCNGIEVVVRRRIAVTRDKSGNFKGTQTAVCRTRKIGDKDWNEVKGRDAVRQAVSEKLGGDIGLMGKYAFISQSAMTEIIDADPSTRTKRLHDLFGLSRYEKMWDMLGQELQSIPVVNPGEDVESLRRDDNKCQGELLSLANSQKKLQSQLAAFDVATAAADTEKWDRSQELQTSITKAESQVTAAQATFDSHDARRKEMELQLAKLVQSQSKLVVDAEAARQFLQRCEDYAAAKNRLTHLSEDARNLVSRISAHTANPPAAVTLKWSSADDEEMAELTTKFMSSSDLVAKHSQLLTQTGVAATCPTCKQPIPDLAATVAEHRKICITLEPRLESLRQQKSAYESAKSRYDRERVEFDTKLAEMRSSADSLQRSIAEAKAAIPADASAFTDAEAAKQRSVIAESDSLAGAISTEQSHLASQRSLTDAAQTNLRAAADTLGSLRSQLQGLGIDPQKFSSDYISRCRETLQSASGVRENLVRIEERIAAAKREHETITQRIQRSEQLSEFADRANLAREVLSNSRDLFHRDCLPMAVAEKFLHAIGSSLDHFLQTMNSNFTATLEQSDGSYQFRCLFPDSSTRLACNLSGGQKVRFAISFLMAVNEVLASKLGMLALDEPTAHLDDDNVQHLTAVLRHVRRFADSAGVQVFLVTHNKQLTGSFDQTITIADGKQAA